VTKASEILAEGKRLAKKLKTWADLSNALFDPLDGLIAQQLPDASTRAEFRKSDVYDELHKLVEQKMQQTGVVSGSKPMKSGRFVVRLPKTLHGALEKEAVTEGTSLNQLVLTKLAVRLSDLTSGGKADLIQAFGEVRERGAKNDEAKPDYCPGEWPEGANPKRTDRGLP
jgi:predicted HicB family RNase H-like nuclease